MPDEIQNRLTKRLGEIDRVFQSTPEKAAHQPMVRTFDTGANRDTEEGKLDYEGFLSPLVLERFAKYMDRNRHLKDGSIRDSDNWQKGIPLAVYIKSGWRHFFAWWKWHRQDHGATGLSEFLEEAICGLLFNAMGYLHEHLKRRHSHQVAADEGEPE